MQWYFLRWCYLLRVIKLSVKCLKKIKTDIYVAIEMLLWPWLWSLLCFAYVVFLQHFNCQRQTKFYWFTRMEVSVLCVRFLSKRSFEWTANHKHITISKCSNGFSVTKKRKRKRKKAKRETLNAELKFYFSWQVAGRIQIDDNYIVHCFHGCFCN